MNITKDQIKETLKNVMTEEADYKAFFKSALEKAGKSIPSMSDEEKKAFFNKIDSAWDAKGEKNEALKGDQHKLDVDGDGDIEADDLADLRAGKKADESVNESTDCGCGCGGCSSSKSIKEKLSKVASSELVFEMSTFLERPIMENKLIKNSEIKETIDVLVNEGIKDVLTNNVKSEFDSLIKKYK